MPPILLKRFSGEIVKNIARNNVINNNNTKSISNSKKLHRRQVTVDSKTKTLREPSPVDSMPTVTISPGPVSFTLISANPTSINPTDIIPTNIIPDATPIPTNINPTDISSTATATPTVINTSTDTAVLATSTGIISSSGIIPTETSTILSSGIPVEPSPIPTITTQSSSPSSPSTSSLPPPLESVSSNNRPPNNLHTWLFPILAISLLVVLAFLGFIYKKRSKNRNIKNNYIQDASTGIITDKDKEHDSKTNSLTSSIHSVSSSFKIKKGRVVPIAPIVADNNNSAPIAPIVADNVADSNGGGKLERPILRRDPTTVSAFRELVDLTDEENDSLRQSIASRLSTAPSFAHNIDFDVEDSTPSNAAIPLHQERINVVIPFSFANEGGGGSASGSGTRTLTTPPFDNINNDNDNQ